VASLGFAGVVIVALVLDRRALIKDRKDAETEAKEAASKHAAEAKEAAAKHAAEAKEAAQKHAAEMEAFHQRYEAKAENWAAHLSDMAAKNQENDAKVITLLDGLLRAMGRKKQAPEP
jgi:uncharacterized protein YcbX